MTSINAGGAFYRVQNAINENSERVSASMQRLSSGLQNVAPGDRVASSAVAYGQKAELASLKLVFKMLLKHCKLWRWLITRYQK